MRTLSDREKIFLEYMAGGLTNHEIANELGISEFTVIDIVSRILLKLDAPNRTRAVTLALEHELITLGGKE